MHPVRHLLHFAEEVVTVCVVPYLVVSVPLQDAHIASSVFAAPHAEAWNMIVARESFWISGHSFCGRHPMAEQVPCSNDLRRPNFCVSGHSEFGCFGAAPLPARATSPALASKVSAFAVFPCELFDLLHEPKNAFGIELSHRAK